MPSSSKLDADSDSDDDYSDDLYEADGDSFDEDSGSSDEEMTMEDAGCSSAQDSDMEVDGVLTPTAESVGDDGDVNLQKDLWQFRMLPYYDELKKDADFHFSHVKTGLAHSVLYRDARPGIIYWLHELDRYMHLYSRRFTKTDHLSLVRLLHSLIGMKDLDFRVVKATATTLTTLLNRKNLLKRTDIQLDWRPLYNLYIEIAYKNLEEDGIFLLPENIQKALEGVIAECNVFFTDAATQEILDEVRPYVCPWDDSMTRGLTILQLFLPTSLDRESHDKFGAKLWFDELWHWFINVECSASVDEKLMAIFARLARDCPGYIDWTDKYEAVFSRLIRSFKLEVGSERVTLNSQSRIHNSSSILIAYTLGGADNGVQSHLDQLFLTVQSYFHPSNHGSHANSLLNFLLKLTTHVLNRVNRERTHSYKYVQPVPASMFLTDQQLDAFTKSILPCLEFGAFTKAKQELVPSIVRIIAFLSPGIIIPFVLDLVYPALETVTEPHRLIQSLHILACVCVPLVRDDPSRSGGERRPVEYLGEDDEDEGDNKTKISYRGHVLTILNNILPGIDVNDIAKSTLTFQIIGVLLLMVPIVDCSEAVHIREDLTDEEKDLCSATASFDMIVEALLEKMFSMIGMFANSSPSAERQTNSKSRTKSVEEMVTEKGVLTVLKALVKNCSSAIYYRICDQFFNFMKEGVFDSKPAMDTVSRMAASVVGSKPSHAFPIFFKYASEKLHKLLTDDVLDEEEVDNAVIWHLTLIAEMMRGATGPIILQHRADVDRLLERASLLKCTDAFTLVGSIVQNMQYGLTAVYPVMSDHHHEVLDQPLDKCLPIRNWAKTVHKNQWKLNWHVPSQEEADYASAINQKFILDQLSVLSKPENLTDKDILKCLTLIHYAIAGSSTLAPYMDGEVIPLIPTHTPNVHFPTTVVPTGTPELKAPDGSNLRRVIFAEINKLADFLLTKRENDTKSILQLIVVLRIVLHVKGVDSASYEAQFQGFQLTKRILADPLRGNIATIESVMEDTIIFMNARRQLSKPLVGLTPTHVEALKLLVRLGTAAYSGVRLQAQKVLDTSFTWWTFSYKQVLDDVLHYVEQGAVKTHDQFKGALYILLNGKQMGICVRQDWETLNRVWPCMVRAEFSEKQSIIALLETAQDIIVNNFSSFQIRFTFPDHVMPLARELLKDYPGNMHKVVWEVPTETELEAAKVREQEKNEKNTREYFKLCNELTKLSTGNLHWRHVDMAQSLLSLMLRRDMAFPDDAVRLFFRLLVHDTLKARKMAIAMVSSWMKIHKPKAVKTPMEVNKGENNGPGAKWPIKYGFREDNQILLYDSRRQPTTAETWNSTRFFSKIHWGFYTWPQEFKTYNPPAEQTNVNRSQDSFSQLEKDICAIFNEPAFLDRFIQLMSIEEKKGSDQFKAETFTFFYGLFRNYNDALLPAFKPHIEKCLTDKREGCQRLASEMVAGLVTGAKLWRYEKLEPMWEWLSPRLLAALESMSNEAEKNWGTAMATIFGSCEVRVVYWLLQLLVGLIKKPSDNSFHVTTRLYLLHCALNQGEWRIMECWRQLFEHCSQLVSQSYQNLRSRVGSCLASTAVCDIRGIYVDPTLEPQFRPVTIAEVVSVMNTKIAPVWKTVVPAGSCASLRSLDSAVDMEIDAASTASSTPNGENGDKKKDKLVLITLVNTLYSLWTQSLHSMPAPTLELIPILAHYTNETSDEELKNSCNVQLVRAMGSSPVPNDNVELLISICSQAATGCSWWKAKLALLKFLQVSVFTNLFVFRHRRDAIRELLFGLLLDAQYDVRVAAAETLSGLIHCAFFSVDASLTTPINQWANSKDPVQRHAGVLSLAAIILAFPYTVPSFLPDVLMSLCRHATEPQPVYGTVKKALNEFKRTHQDCWHEHKLEFNEDQLRVLTDLLISPNYYV